MSDTIHRYLIKYPHARTSTVQYLAKRDETTERLKAEYKAEYKAAVDRINRSTDKEIDEAARKHRERTPKPWWQRFLRRLA